VRTQVVTPALAAAWGADASSGLRISQILPWSSAEIAGLEVGDVVVAVEGEPLDAEREQDSDVLRQVVERHSIGDTVVLRVIRFGAEREIPVTLEARPLDPSEVRSTKQELLGFSARELTIVDRAQHHLDRAQRGTVVTEVISGGWAQMAGLEPDDLVLSVSDEEVNDVPSLERVLSRAVAARPEVLKIFVRRGARTHFVFLEPKWGDGADGSRGGGKR